MLYIPPVFKLRKNAMYIMVSSTFFCNYSEGAQTYSFDASLLNGGGKGINLSLFEEGSQLPGVYPVDIILNGSRVDSREIDFRTERGRDGRPYLKSCLTREMLIRYGVKVEEYPELFRLGVRAEKSGEGGQVCAELSAIPGATEMYQFMAQQLLLGIPQAALQPQFSGIAPEALWDDGMPAFLLNWQANVSHSEYRELGKSASDSFWAALEPGINVGSWRIRNLTTWNKSSGQSGKWESSYIRAERGLNGIKSRLTLGESYTPSDIFDSVPFRGGMLGSDEDMVPYSQREFAPVVRGIARTQARIEVRQNGYLIHSLTVAPGAFSLTDLPATGSGGDLQVTVLESDGTTQVFTVPFTTPAIALREGYMKYNITGGQYRSYDNKVEHTLLGQATVMYGLPLGGTVFGGIQMAEHYWSGALGGGLSLGSLGAVSVDVIHSRGQLKRRDNESGNAWRVRYDKSFELTGTSFSAASYLYPSDGYYTLSDVLDSYRHHGRYAYSSSEYKGYRTTLNLSQSLGMLGYMSFWGSRDEYHGSRTHRDSMGVSYSTTWKDISMSVNWSRNRNTRGYDGRWQGKTEDNVNVWMSIPLGRWSGNTVTNNDIRATAQMQHAIGQNARYEAGMNGRIFDGRLYWDIREQVTPEDKTNRETSRLNLTWYGTYGEATGIYSYSSHMRQMSAGLSGGLVVHRHGVTLGQRTGETVALVGAPGVSGASVSGWPGVRTDFRGYTLTGWLSPYQENVVSLDPTTFPDNAEVPQTDSRVVPTKGAVVSAKFITHVGGRALLTLLRADGTPLPFGTVVTVEEPGHTSGTVGVVGNNGEVYMSGLAENGRVKAQWGESSQCHADYHLPDEKGAAGVFLTRSVCM
ncbi:fimbria/pilus outer membrane usher protein (plasmid) [Escherichia coli O170:H18]|uniref:fimbria/pilus outer membrane usher protein n=1 Tax=Escherichia coli TaxID=562 RepID=UPI001C1F457D|nr:fimbria/pilus outer membrane usher protein [Escherichia coli]QWV76887.1 fimbria/pilus outer membrane usher protein [Escherichia coli O170:H18]